MDPEVTGLYHAYYHVEENRPFYLSLRASAQVARYMVRRGRDAEALAIGDALLGWQHSGDGEDGLLLGGAFPTEIVRRSDGYDALPVYDSADNLAIIEALLDLHSLSGHAGYLAAAVRAGEWLRDVMAHGELYGVWLEPYGVPMASVLDGALDNRIPIGRTAFWIPTLRRLGALAGVSGFDALADRLTAFGRLGQNESGGFYDHYEPGWPPAPFHQDRFQAYGYDNSVVADDSIRAAISAVQRGDLEMAERFTDWLSTPAAGIFGYISLLTGDGLFVEGDLPYYDVVSTGLIRSLYERLGFDVQSETAFLIDAQYTNGGWYWGLVASDGEPITGEQATLTGLWAVMDLSPRDG